MPFLTGAPHYALRQSHPSHSRGAPRQTLPPPLSEASHGAHRKPSIWGPHRALTTGTHSQHDSPKRSYTHAARERVRAARRTRYVYSNYAPASPPPHDFHTFYRSEKTEENSCACALGQGRLTAGLHAIKLKTIATVIYQSGLPASFETGKSDKLHRNKDNEQTHTHTRMEVSFCTEKSSGVYISHNSPVPFLQLRTKESRQPEHLQAL